MARRAPGAARPTPPRGSIPDMRRERGGMAFLRDVYAELRKVVWPSRQESTRLTILVLTVSLAIGLILALVDFAFNQLLGGILF